MELQFIQLGPKIMFHASFSPEVLFALDRTVQINWSEGNNAAPLDTMLIINKTLSIQPNSVSNGVKIFSHVFHLFGYQMPNDVKEYGDMIVCVKVASDKWKISSFTAIDFFGAGGGGTWY